MHYTLEKSCSIYCSQNPWLEIDKFSNQSLAIGVVSQQTLCRLQAKRNEDKFWQPSSSLPKFMVVSTNKILIEVNHRAYMCMTNYN